MKSLFVVILSACLAIGLVGCISKPYVMTMDRVDQKMEIGNRGYLKGTPPPLEDRGDLKRSFIAVDIDLPPARGEEAKLERGPAIEQSERPLPVERQTPVKEEAKREEEIK